MNHRAMNSFDSFDDTFDTTVNEEVAPSPQLSVVPSRSVRAASLYDYQVRHILIFFIFAILLIFNKSDVEFGLLTLQHTKYMSQIFYCNCESFNMFLVC